MSNVFSMRMIGNKTHGDLAEIAFAEFITQHLDGYSATHVGKDLFRAKTAEEDILVHAPGGVDIPVSLKAYGVGPLQLSTNKSSSMFAYLEQNVGKAGTTDQKAILAILDSPAFADFHSVNVLPLIYDEKKKLFNIIVFDVKAAYRSVQRVEYVSQGSGRKHPIYKFSTADGQYIFEVRYGDVAANALQRGLWTHTRNAGPFIKSLTGWMNYSINLPLLDVLSKLLVATEKTHIDVLKNI